MIESFLKWWRGGEEKRAVSASLSQESFWSWLSSNYDTYAGTRVTEQSGLNFSAVFRAVHLIAGTASTLTCRAYETLNENARRPAPELRVDKLMNDEPNPEMDGATFRETMFGHLLTWGNCYAEKEFLNSMEIQWLWPLSPDRVTPKRVNGELVYEVRGDDGRTRTLERERVFHVPCFGFDGICGYSPVAMARQAIGLGLAAEQFGARFYGSGTHLGGIIERPQGAFWTDEGAKRFKEDFANFHKGVGNSHKVAVLEDGMKYSRLGIPPDEAQFLETRKFQINEIARWFGVPPHLLYDLDRSTFSNIEHQGIEFLTYSLRYWLTKWERAVRRQLMSAEDRERFYVEHITQGLVKADIAARYNAYAIGRSGGWLSVNDIRRAENQNPIEGGDTYLVPLNMAPADKPLPDTKSEGVAA